MNRFIKLFLVVGMLGLIASPAWAVPLFPNEFTTFNGAGLAEDAGHAGAAAGTQAALWNYTGAQPSLDLSGVSGFPLLVNLPQSSLAVQAALGGGVGGATGVPTPAGFIFETTQAKDGTSVSFGQELTAVVGGLFPTALIPTIHAGALDNGLAPGSTALDGNFDQLVPLPVPIFPVASFAVTFGPGSLGLPGFLANFPAPPVFEIYEDVPPTLNLNIGVATPIREEMFDFDGAGVPVGPTVPPPTATPSQFENGADGFPLPNDVSAATDGTLFAAGWIETATAMYTFFDPSVIGSMGGGPTGGFVYRIDFTGTGVIVDGSILPLVKAFGADSVWDPTKQVNITFAATLFGEAYPTVGNGVAGFVGTDGMDPFATWDIRTSLAGNSGDASFTIFPIPEPTTLALLGLGIVPLILKRRKQAA